MEHLSSFAMGAIEALVYLLVFVIGCVVAWGYSSIVQIDSRRKVRCGGIIRFVRGFVIYSSIWANFFRQYFSALDREEMPFNRAERSWVYRAAKDIDSMVAFGSTRDLRQAGTVYFVNCPFPTLEEDAADTSEILVGPYCLQPYATTSLFNISALSYGAISIPAVRALSVGAKSAGIWMTTGESGLSPYHLEGGADIVFQIGTAKFGVHDPKGGFDEEKLRSVAAHEQVKMFEIKLSQGSKAGKGGMILGSNVNAEVAKMCGFELDQNVSSPNRHPEIDSVSGLLDMVDYVRKTTGKPTGFKAVIGRYDWIETLCAEIHQRGIESAPDFIAIDSADGGSGAAPMSLIDNMGIPIKESLPHVVDILIKHGLRDRIKICASGKLITPADVAWAFCVGADFVNSARGFMFALGCIQSLQCNKNTCPTGITTHNKRLQYGLNPADKAVRVANYAKNMHKEISIIAHSCGAAEPRQLQRMHARIVLAEGKSVSLDKLYPEAA